MDGLLANFRVRILRVDAFSDDFVELTQEFAVLRLVGGRARRCQSLDEDLDRRESLACHLGVAVLSRRDQCWDNLVQVSLQDLARMVLPDNAEESEGLDPQRIARGAPSVSLHRLDDRLDDEIRVIGKTATLYRDHDLEKRHDCKLGRGR